MKSYRIVLEYTDASDERDSPYKWDWHDLIAGAHNEEVSLVEVSEIPTPEGHLETLTEE